MPAVRTGLVLVNVDDVFYALGGEDANDNPVTANWAYTPDYALSSLSPTALVAAAVIVSVAIVFVLAAYFLRRKRKSSET